MTKARRRRFKIHNEIIDLLECPAFFGTDIIATHCECGLFVFVASTQVFDSILARGPEGVLEFFESAMSSSKSFGENGTPENS